MASIYRLTDNPNVVEEEKVVPETVTPEQTIKRRINVKQLRERIVFTEDVLRREKETLKEIEKILPR